MHHVIEVLQITLMYTEGDRSEIREDIPHVMEEHAADVIADKRKAKFGGMEEQRISPNGKPGIRIAWAGLIVRKSAVGRGSSRPKSFLKGNISDRGRIRW